MKKLLSIFMSMVMVVTMLPKVSFAAEINEEEITIEEQQTKETNTEEGSVNTDSGGAFKYLQDKFSLLTGFVKEKAPQVWDKLKPYFDQGKTWAKNYYDNVSVFAEKVGKLGVVATVGLSVLLCKIAYKVIGFVAKLIWPTDTQGSGQFATNNYSKTSIKPYSGSYTYCV